METAEQERPLRKMKAVIFDFDGTLAILNIDFSLMKDQVFGLMRRFRVNEASVRERYLLEIIDEVCEGLLENKSPGAEAFYEEAHRILHTVEIKAAEEGRLLPGAKSALRQLRSQGMKIGIVTRNCEDAVRKVFPDIQEFCDVFISRDSTKKVKPHPDHLIAVMRALNVSGEEAVMVGDHPIDIEAGKRVGMTTIGVLTGRSRREEFVQARADFILRNVTEVSLLLGGVNMGKKAIQTEKAPKAIGPYSQAMQAGNLIFLSGQIPIVPATGNLVEGDMRQQVRQVLENMKAVLESEGLGMEDVVKTTIFLRDMGKFNDVNDVYGAYFPAPPPARSTVEVSNLPRNVDVEIEAIALTRNGPG